MCPICLANLLLWTAGAFSTGFLAMIPLKKSRLRSSNCCKTDNQKL